MVSEVEVPSAQNEVRTHSVDSFAAALRALRRQAGEPTLVALSAHTGVSKSVISEALSGRALPSERTVFHLVRVLGGDPDSWLAQRGALDPRRSIPASVPPSSSDAESTGVEPISAEPLTSGVATRFWRQHPRIIIATTTVLSAIMTSMIWALIETH